MSSFASPDSLWQMISAHKSGIPVGVYSVCSANSFVIEACMKQAIEDGSDLLIEATCNQINQFGGYTGMTPVDFASAIRQIAGRNSFPVERVSLGGDHLGPSPWQDDTAESAMQKSRQMVRDYVLAGFVKIHLDASMRCADDDPQQPLDPELSAERAADLCAVAELTSAEMSSAQRPVYVIGTEVPTPGGATVLHDRPRVTGAAEAQQTLDLFRRAFEQRRLSDAWTRVIGLVVQPGVEFNHAEIYEYNRERARDLSKMIETVPGIVFEAHSTDYQRPGHLRQMVEDHFAILKVGPALTFALREAVFALVHIEREWLGARDIRLSNLIEVVDRVMVEDPAHWLKYYAGDEAEKAFARRYSLSDRIRYYWPHPVVQKALTTLLDNLSLFPAPLSLLSQYLPAQHSRVRKGLIRNDPRHLIWDHIREVAAHYGCACKSLSSNGQPGS